MRVLSSRAFCFLMLAVPPVMATTEAAGVDHQGGNATARQLGSAAQVTKCFFDSSLLVWYVAQAGAGIHDATKSCPDKDIDDEHSRKCASDVTGIIGSFASVSSFIAAVVAGCPGVFGKGAKCAAFSAELIGSVMHLVSASSTVDLECESPNHGTGEEECEGNGLDQWACEQVGCCKYDHGQCWSSVASGACSRRLAERSEADTASCVVDAFTATFLIGQAALEIAAATESCPKDYAKAACAVDVGGLVRSLTAMIQFISSAAAECGAIDNIKARCSSAVAELVSALAAMVTASAGIKATCHDEDEYYDDYRSNGMQPPPPSVALLSGAYKGRAANSNTPKYFPDAEPGRRLYPEVVV